MTRWGEARTCDECGATMTEGPDACLGILPGVKEACCGHGSPDRAYVLLDGGVMLRGGDALRYFGKPTWPSRPGTSSGMGSDQRALWEAVTRLLGESRETMKPASDVIDVQGQQVKLRVEAVWPANVSSS